MQKGRAQSGLAGLSSQPAPFWLSMLRRWRGGLGLLHSEVFERQRRPGLERLNGNVAAYLTHDWQIEELPTRKR
jgi:hypothetical protein